MSESHASNAPANSASENHDASASPSSVLNPPWKLNIEAGLYEAVIERLQDAGSRDPEGDLNDLVSNHLAKLALQGKQEIYREFSFEKDDRREFLERRRAEVAEEFSGEYRRQCLDELALDANIGSDGGNWASSLWVFGLEAGGSLQIDEKEGPFVDLTPRQRLSFESGIPEDPVERAAWFDAYPYNRYLLRFCLAYYGLCNKEEAKLPTADLASLAIAKKLFAPDGPCFKGNLYPLQRPSHGFWNRLTVRYKGFNFGPIERVLGLKLNDYQEEMAAKRRLALAEKIADNARGRRPTVIVCRGLNSISHFAEAFCARMEDFEEISVDVFGRKNPKLARIEKITLMGMNAPRYVDDIWLFVVPHCRGLAYVDEWEYGNALREALKARKAPPVWELGK